MKLLMEEHLQVVAIYHGMKLADVACAAAHPLQTVGTDGILADFPHPRAYGTFPRLIARFCRKEASSLEETIRKMTSAPAGRLNLEDRGSIQSGAFADLLIFDPENFKDHATYDNPKQFATGLDWMFVNGQPVIEDGNLKEIFAGRVIRKK